MKLMPVVGKLFHKIFSHHLRSAMMLLIIDNSVQRGFVTGLLGVFEHIYTLLAIMHLQDALINKHPLKS